MTLYWHVGGIISQRVEQAGGGKGVVAELARYIAQADPSVKGFIDKNLWRMKQFYEAYQGDEELAPLARELSWNKLNHEFIFMALNGRCYPRWQR